MSELVWGAYDVGAGEPHPTEPLDPSGEPWTHAVLSDAADTTLARLWVGTIHTRVVADFSFDDALHGTVDAAVLPLVVDGFFGDDGHTLGYYRDRDRYGDARLTNLRTGSCWSMSWDSIEELAAEFRASPQFVARAMR